MGIAHRGNSPILGALGKPQALGKESAPTLRAGENGPCLALVICGSAQVKSADLDHEPYFKCK